MSGRRWFPDFTLVTRSFFLHALLSAQHEAGSMSSRITLSPSLNHGLAIHACVCTRTRPMCVHVCLCTRAHVWVRPAVHPSQASRMQSSTPSPCCRPPLEPLLLSPLRLPHHQPPRTHSQPARCPLSLSATPRKLTGLSHQLHAPWDYQHAAGEVPSCTRTLNSFSLCSMPAHCRVLV